METVEYFSDFIRKIGSPNFLAIGIVIIFLWLLISGFRKGLKRRSREKSPEDNGEHKEEK